MRYTLESFIEKSMTIHNNKYDYRLIKEYINYTTKIKIICPIHGEFKQTPKNHLLGRGCPYCGNTKKYNTNTFIKKSKIIHGNKYDYSLVEYINSKEKIILKCPIHGNFLIQPYKHLQKQGCSKCYGNYPKTTNQFIKEAIKIHSNKYDYSLVEYINNKTNIKIICDKHGIFKQNPKSHLNNSGCPLCNESKGEKKIRLFLEKNKIKFIYQKTFNNCKNINLLQFDFYLPEKNTCIEFDGKQHYKINEYFGGEKEFKLIKKRDKIKNDYCKQNNINLIRIKYNENIENKLNDLK